MDGKATEEQLLGGELNAAIARCLVRARRQYVGRGPTKAQAFHRHNIIVVILHDTMTTAERSLVTAGKADAVLGMRRELRDALRAEMVSVVEAATGCRVVAFVSGDQIDPDVATEVFILDRPVPGGAARSPRVADETVARRPPAASDWPDRARRRVAAAAPALCATAPRMALDGRGSRPS
jgi:uncharacterized protein YbcI